MHSMFDPLLGLSVEAPDGWAQHSTEDFPFLLLAPREADYSSNLGFSRSGDPSPSPEGMQRAIAAARAEQEAEYPGFIHLAERHGEVDGFPAYIQIYSWQPESAPQPFVQIYGLVLTERNGLIEINGATLATLSATVLGQFDAIIASIRFIPLADARVNPQG